MDVPLKKLEDQLNCSICMETYINPRQLQCNHVYCQRCLVRLVSRDKQGQLILNCPSCRQVTHIPANGVAGLQAAFRINQLLEIVEEHKKVAGSPEKVDHASENHTSHGVSCHEHGGKEVELYCETCEKTICWECIMKGSKHHSHEYQKLNEAFEQYKVEITSLLEPQLAVIEEALKAFDARQEEISDQQVTIEIDIHNTITEHKKTELISQLNQLTQAKLKSLTTQRDQIETTQAQLSSCLLFLRENLKTKNYREALMMKSTTVRQVKKLTTTFQPDMLEPNVEADLTFTVAISKKAAASHFNNAPDSECQDRNAENEVCPDPSEGLTTDATVAAAVGESASQHRRERPPPIGPPLEILNNPIRVINGVKGSIGVVVNRRGEVIVTEDGGHRVSMFRLNGEKLRCFGTCGSAEGEFQHPNGVAVDGEDNIFVADSGNHRIQKFTPQGECLEVVGTKGDDPLQFDRPYGIVVNAANGRVYVVETGNHRVQILNPDLSYFDTIGIKGTGQGQFKSPRHVACDSTGNVYVADRGNNRIQVFTAEGKFLRKFGRPGKEKGELSMPYGIAIDSSNRVYVSEGQNNRVSVFTSEGQFLTSFGGEGKGSGQFEQPQGIAVDGGVVCICEKNRNRVQLFKIK